MKKIIFHHPLPLDPNAKSASGIRPQRILQAFRDQGYQVDLVTGYAAERKAAIKQIKQNIKNGIKYDFMYAESSTMPTILTEQHHLPSHPFMDWLFFEYCKKKNIEIGLFYRDIYWLFDEYGKGLNPIKAVVAKLAYRFDLWVYERTLKKLYLPSEPMGSYIPTVSKTRLSALPPGHASPQLNNLKPIIPIKLFYVGGLSWGYQMQVLFEVLNDYPQIEFTLCTREEEWKAMQQTYPNPSNNINIIHESGKEMENHLRTSDILCLFVKPQEYWDFAVPFKLFEYLGYKKPILSSANTLAGDFVKDNNIGFSIAYKKEELMRFFDDLISNPEMLLEKSESLKHTASNHSWQARAKQVIKDLSNE